MATSERVTVRGAEAVNASLHRYQRGIIKTTSKAAYAAAKLVAMDARPRFQGIDPKTATGFVPNVRAGSARVRQRRGKTTGQRPDFGSLQMRLALLPALYAKQHEAVALFEVELSRLQKEAGL